MRHRFVHFTFACGLVVVAMSITGIAAFAQDGGSLSGVWERGGRPLPPAEIVRMFDTDGNASITRAELRLKIIEVFDRLDRNNNGRLSNAELPGVSSGTFSAADTDRNGTLSAIEFLQADFTQFDNIDGNRDGRITADEISAYRRRAR